MPVLQEILDWSASRPEWQQDALRRLVVNGELTAADIAELMRICKAEHGLDDPSGTASAPQPLAPEHLPSAVATAQAVCILGIREVCNVNALAADQRLNFAPSGLTIVYGDNGSGKSGYARILRHICRARARGEMILPNVFDGSVAGAASATIDYQTGNEDRTDHWQAGQPVPSDLSAVSFFDSACASVHVRDANELAFTPHGLDILPKLAAACRKINSSLTRECDQLEQAKPVSLREPEAKKGTEVRNRLDGLIAASADITTFERLAKLTEPDEARILELREAMGDDPGNAARVLRVRQMRVHRLAEEVSQVETALSDDAISTIRGLFDNAVAKESAARLAAQEEFVDQPLPNVGSRTWRVLWESARRYSEAEAYPDREFPAVDGDARCVVCQQLLSPDAATRLRRFDAFVRQDTQALAQEARKNLTDAVETLSALRLRRQNYGDSVKDAELENEELATELRRFIVQARLRRRCILRSCTQGAWSELSDLPDASASAAAAMSDELLVRAQRLELAATSAEREKLQGELDELLARQWLSNVLEDVRKEIGRLRRLDKLASANRDTATTGITRKNGELTNLYVTDALRSRFTGEVANLGAGYLQLQLDQAGGEYGSMRFRIQINGAEQPSSLASVLSEGEYRCIALAGFLAELATSNSQSGLVFDDPVCSLDHRWRRQVAERLVKEAQSRQVIVFTHDVVFLLDLLELCDQRGVTCAQSQLQRSRQQVGICMDGVPWVSMKLNARIGWLRNNLQEVATVRRQEGEDRYDPLARRIYGRLREAWERGVEEVLLNGAVVRFGRSVHTQRLRSIPDITPEDIHAVDEGMSKASRFMEGHDEAGAINEAVPDPNEIGDDIQSLDRWAQGISKRRR